MREETGKKTVRFQIPEKGLGKYSLNRLYSGRHWSIRQREAEYWHMLVQSELRRQKVPKKLLNPPVAITLYYNTAMDVDNHGYISKMIVDGMKGYLIEDDRRKYVQYLGQGFHDGDGIIVEVEER